MSQFESESEPSAGEESDPALTAASVTRIRELNERIIDAAKGAGLSSLDAYERALSNLAEFEGRVAAGTQLDWVSALAQAHAQMVQDMSGAYVQAARKMLK